MGRRPTHGDEKRLSCSNCSPWARYPPPCHPERSRGTCGSADLSWKCFPTERTRYAAVGMANLRAAANLSMGGDGWTESSNESLHTYADGPLSFLINCRPKSFQA